MEDLNWNFKAQVNAFLIILGARTGRGHGIGLKKMLRTCLACRAMPLPCLVVWLSHLLRTGLASPSSPAMMVDLGALFNA